MCELVDIQVSRVYEILWFVGVITEFGEFGFSNFLPVRMEGFDTYIRTMPDETGNIIPLSE